MELFTHYEIGDHFWTLQNNRAQMVEITGIFIQVNSAGKQENSYRLTFAGTTKWDGDRSEQTLTDQYYRTKDALINSL